MGEAAVSDGGDPPAFNWRRTFADTHHDFVAQEGTVEVGRIIAKASHDKTWKKKHKKVKFLRL